MAKDSSWDVLTLFQAFLLLIGRPAFENDRIAGILILAASARPFPGLRLLSVTKLKRNPKMIRELNSRPILTGGGVPVPPFVWSTLSYCSGGKPPGQRPHGIWVSDFSEMGLYVF
ncbi:hypothetical protein EG329_011632 [Mollisiaceae sp. DMI_Dod_QoI]|nr:hypothetical protein EG329_011632 [Helotiales sp. DMI_Dod_QoI]